MISVRPKAGGPIGPFCIKCGRELTNLDIGLHKKMINRGSKEFMCIDCLSAHIDIPVPELLEKAELFRKQGCTLFT